LSDVSCHGYVHVRGRPALGYVGSHHDNHQGPGRAAGERWFRIGPGLDGSLFGRRGCCCRYDVTVWEMRW
jgi:hypothetical protein